jgi:outer membrane murein-binding lipoprotein Lpp
VAADFDSRFFNRKKRKMKQISLKTLLFAVTLATGVNLSSCKNKAKDGAPTTTTSVDSNNANMSAPDVSSDDALNRGVTDATKDYPGVSATVVNGEVTLTGSIERDKLPKLMQSVQALSPRKVNNQLTIK